MNDPRKDSYIGWLKRYGLLKQFILDNCTFTKLSRVMGNLGYLSNIDFNKYIVEVNWNNLSATLDSDKIYQYVVKYITEFSNDAELSTILHYYFKNITSEYVKKKIQDFLRENHPKLVDKFILESSLL